MEPMECPTQSRWVLIWSEIARWQQHQHIRQNGLLRQPAVVLSCRGAKRKGSAKQSPIENACQQPQAATVESSSCSSAQPGLRPAGLRPTHAPIEAPRMYAHPSPLPSTLGLRILSLSAPHPNKLAQPSNCPYNPKSHVRTPRRR